jgi:hypothetical protein
VGLDANRRNDPELQSIDALGLEPLRDYRAERPELAAALLADESWLRTALETFASELPRPPSAGTFVQPPYYRPPGAHRSFYVSALAGEARTDSPRSVIAIKGLEPLAPDFDDAIESFQRPSHSPHTIAEHLIFEEHKIPGCLSLAEALREAEHAAEVQGRHLRAYGELARLPVPLFLYRHSEDVAQVILETLRRHLSDPALDAVEPLLAAGLGVYLFSYPTPPVRASDLDSVLTGLRFHERMFALIALCDPELVIRRWVRGFVRMLYLDVAPGSLAWLRGGVCCQPQNACIDGGFVDLGSLTPFAGLHDDAAVDAALQLSFESLLLTVRTLVVGGADRPARDRAEVRVDDHQLTRCVLALIEEALESEARAGLELDPRVRSYFTAPQSLDELVARLGRYYGSRTPDLGAAAQRFSALAPSLIRATQDVSVVRHADPKRPT